jgi:hypothetical protein
MPYGPFLSVGALITLVFRGHLTAFLAPLEQLIDILF